MERTGGSGGPEPGSTPVKGSGEVSPVTGLPRFFDAPQDSGITWRVVLSHWQHIEADVQEHYGIDLAAPGLLDGRSGRWLRVRILGLLDVESRLHHALFPPKDEGAQSWP